jgi:hypothetical protein
VIYDAALESFAAAMSPLEEKLAALFDEQKRAEEERSSRDTLRTIQRAFREAMFALPAEEYDWFDINSRQKGAATEGAKRLRHGAETEGIPVAGEDADTPPQRCSSSMGCQRAHCARSMAP